MPIIYRVGQILNDSDIVPAVNMNPFLYQKDLLLFCEKNGIQLEAYSPLTRGKRLNHPTIVKIAKKYGNNKTPAQILIRWSLQHNLVVIPKYSLLIYIHVKRKTTNICNSVSNHNDNRSNARNARC